ncbi:MAG: 50S ribosomal protein L27 [Candidatus Shapirobacteria bacterium]
MSTAKQGGKTRQQSPRPGKRLGVKVFGGGRIKIGSIIVRQRGSGFHPGEGVRMGRDFTLFALKEGIVKFGKRRGKKIVYVSTTGY